MQSLGTLDGPGLRSVLFLQGCPLRCPYCHNPDTWNPAGGCEMRSDDAAQRLLRYRPYWGANGGVTVSGGEPLMQAEFAGALFARLQKAGVHTALDTAGACTGAGIDALLRHSNLVLLDIKMNSPADYERHIGMKMQKTLDFLDRLEALAIPTWLRQVIIPGCHDRPGQMQALGQIANSYECVKRVELLPYARLALEKYQAMSIAYPMGDTPVPSQDMMDTLREQLAKNTAKINN